jgi:hypothetical protein
MNKTIDDLAKELNEWLGQPALKEKFDEKQRLDLYLVLCKYFTDEANDMDILMESFVEGVHELATLKSENISLRSERDIIAGHFIDIRLILTKLLEDIKNIR